MRRAAAAVIAAVAFGTLALGGCRGDAAGSAGDQLSGIEATLEQIEREIGADGAR